MTDYYDASEMSPVPVPDAVAPEPCRAIYAMPSFATIPTTDLETSVGFWTHALGFLDLFTIPGRLTHLRRWAFQDVLLTPAATPPPARTTPVRLNFACVMGQIDAIVDACRAIDPDCVGGPRDTPWNTRDVEVDTPGHALVVFTAARSPDPHGREARNLHAMGIGGPANATGR